MTSTTHPSLSVCCMTGDPPERVVAVLEPWRAVADEIVVAVDDRVDRDALGALCALADVVIRFPYRPPVDRARPWVAERCAGRWLLMVDGDEVPSPALVDRMPSLIADRDVVQYRLARRWVWPDPAHWLAEVPWWPDFQPRLVRNEPALLRFGTQPHQSLLGLHPADHVLEPLYHLDTVLRTPGERRRKARAYEAADPGRQAYGGGPLSATFYEPERTATLRPRPVPVEDRPWIDRVVAAASREGTTAPRARLGAPVRNVPSAEIDASAPPFAFEDGWHRADLEVVEVDLRLAPGEVRPVLVRVGNRSPVLWPDAGDPAPELRVSYHLVDGSGAVVVAEGLRTALPRRLRPGADCVVPVMVAAPERPGRYELRVDLVDEGVRWFGCATSASILVAGRWQRFAVDPRAATVDDPAVVDLAVVDRAVADAAPAEVAGADLPAATPSAPAAIDLRTGPTAVHPSRSTTISAIPTDGSTPSPA